MNLWHFVESSSCGKHTVCPFRGTTHRTVKGQHVMVMDVLLNMKIWNLKSDGASLPQGNSERWRAGLGFLCTLRSWYIWHTSLSSDLPNTHSWVLLSAACFSCSWTCAQHFPIQRHITSCMRYTHKVLKIAETSEQTACKWEVVFPHVHFQKERLLCCPT